MGGSSIGKLPSKRKNITMSQTSGVSQLMCHHSKGTVSCYPQPNLKNSTGGATMEKAFLCRDHQHTFRSYTAEVSQQRRHSLPNLSRPQDLEEVFNRS